MGPRRKRCDWCGEIDALKVLVERAPDGSDRIVVGACARHLDELDHEVGDFAKRATFKLVSAEDAQDARFDDSTNEKAAQLLHGAMQSGDREATGQTATTRQYRSIWEFSVVVGGMILVASAAWALFRWIPSGDSNETMESWDSDRVHQINASPGQTVDIRLKLPESIGGRWASSTGIHGSVSSSIYGPIIVFERGPKEPDWGRSIETGSSIDYQLAVVTWQFQVPDDLPVGTTLEGTIEGQLITPVQSVADLGAFRHLREDVLVNVRLVVDNVDRSSFKPPTWLAWLAGIGGFLFIAIGSYVGCQRENFAPYTIFLGTAMIIFYFVVFDLLIGLHDRLF